ncbi:MAG: hypothetical protein ACSHYF_18285 [Verrucomicrobiaceae bacterium]
MPAPTPITPKTIGKFLLGNRDAIRTISSSHKSLYLSFLFIISAGLARNYDHHILWKEWLWIGGPVLMALFSSCFIFAFIKMFGGLRGENDNCCNFAAFFRCFVMTAPLAWLYGFPIEEFTGPLPATIFNFTILIIVSLWRLILMIRVTSVLFGYHPSRAFALVAIPASVEMFFATLVSSVSIVGIMGGMKLSEADRFLLNATSVVTMSSVAIFVIGILVGIFGPKGDVKPASEDTPLPRITLPSWIAAGTIIILWIALAIVPQTKLNTRDHFRILINNGQYAEAAAFTRTKTRDDFPAHQILLKKHHGFRSPPDSMRLLAHHQDWPDWLRKELEEDIHHWISGIPDRISGEARDLLIFDHIADAPFARQVVGQFLPSLDLNEWLEEEKDESKSPSP